LLDLVLGREEIRRIAQNKIKINRSFWKNQPGDGARGCGLTRLKAVQRLQKAEMERAGLCFELVIPCAAVP
jgi:hypothetical protein